MLTYKAAGRSKCHVKPTGVRQMMAQFIRLSDAARHPGCPVHASSNDAGGYAAILFRSLTVDGLEFRFNQLL